MQEKMDHNNSMSFASAIPKSLQDIQETSNKNIHKNPRNNAIIDALETPIVSVKRKKKADQEPAIYSESVYLPSKEIKLDSIPEYSTNKLMVCKEVSGQTKFEISNKQSEGEFSIQNLMINRQSIIVSIKKKFKQLKNDDCIWEKQNKININSYTNANCNLGDLLNVKIESYHSSKTNGIEEGYQSAKSQNQSQCSKSKSPYSHQYIENERFTMDRISHLFSNQKDLRIRIGLPLVKDFHAMPTPRFAFNTNSDDNNGKRSTRIHNNSTEQTNRNKQLFSDLNLLHPEAAKQETERFVINSKNSSIESRKDKLKLINKTSFCSQRNSTDRTDAKTSIHNKHKLVISRLSQFYLDERKMQKIKIKVRKI